MCLQVNFKTYIKNIKNIFIHTIISSMRIVYQPQLFPPLSDDNPYIALCVYIMSVFYTKSLIVMFLLSDDNPCMTNSTLCSQTGQYCLPDTNAVGFVCECRAFDGYSESNDGSCTSKLGLSLSPNEPMYIHLGL